MFLEGYLAAEGDARARLAEALGCANAAILGEAAEKPALRGMGCTLVGVAFAAEGTDWISVGDSPLYLVRKGEIVRLNEDHSLAPEIDRLAELGHISWAAAQADPNRHVLRSALTGTTIEMIDRPRAPLLLEPDDMVILASDGIHSLAEAEIARIAAAAGTPAAAADALLTAVAAVDDPHQDNTTVVVVRVIEEGGIVDIAPCRPVGLRPDHFTSPPDRDPTRSPSSAHPEALGALVRRGSR